MPTTVPVERVVPSAVRDTRIELVSAAWEAAVLPLNESRERKIL